MTQKIDTYYKKQYLFTTCQYKTIKELKDKLSKQQGDTITIASIPNKLHKIEDITNYSFRISKGGV